MLFFTCLIGLFVLFQYFIYLLGKSKQGEWHWKNIQHRKKTNDSFNQTISTVFMIFYKYVSLNPQLVYQELIYSINFGFISFFLCIFILLFVKSITLLVIFIVCGLLHFDCGFTTRNWIYFILNWATVYDVNAFIIKTLLKYSYVVKERVLKQKWYTNTTHIISYFHSTEHKIMMMILVFQIHLYVFCICAKENRKSKLSIINTLWLMI